MSQQRYSSTGSSPSNEYRYRQASTRRQHEEGASSRVRQDEGVEEEEETRVRDKSRERRTVDQLDTKRSPDANSPTTTKAYDRDEHERAEYLHGQADPYLDPYNNQHSLVYRQNLEPQSLLYDVVDQLNDPSQVVYDSMSTILEVDSEDSEQSSSAQHIRSADLRRLLDSPQTARDATTTTTTTPSERNRSNAPLEAVSPSVSTSDSLAGRVSPVEQDRFRGTLSALAEQVERLRRSSIPSVTSPIQVQTHSQSDTGHNEKQQPVVESKAEVMGESRRSQTERSDGATSPMSTGAAGTTTPLGTAAGSHKPKSRANSAESLMMITVSPMGSPRVKFPLVRQRKQQRYAQNSDDNDYDYDRAQTSRGVNVYDYDDNDEDEDEDRYERRLVEVSNKSTITAIDLNLMEKMAQKYFVEKSDKASQSVKFDCEDTELDSTTLHLIAASDEPAGKRVKCRSVAVGTEKFSRERFSLLPPTSTRSTQTKPNIADQDLGTSETRRYKLSHQQFKPTSTSRRREQVSIATATEPTGSVEESLPTAGKSEERRSIAVETQAAATSELDSLSETAKFVGCTRTATEQPGEDSLNEGSVAAGSPVAATPAIATDSSSSSSSPVSASADEDSVGGRSVPATPVPPAKEFETSISTKVNNKTKEKKAAVDSVKKRQDKDVEIVGLGKTPSLADENRANLIPSVKTELRVIIEFQNAKQRQQSELISDSSLINGKLSKKTQVRTSKQVAASPREVLQRLQTAGRQHSLLYQDPRSLSASSNSTTAAVAAANQSAVTKSRLTSSKQIPAKSNDLKTGDGEWREVSRSCVSNEIETDTRRRVADRDSRRKRDNASTAIKVDGAIVMSSDAIIKHGVDDKSAIELKSRAARQYERYERDPQSGELVRGQAGERTLVESEATFDETDEHLHLQLQPQSQSQKAKQQSTTSAAETGGERRVKGTGDETARKMSMTPALKISSLRSRTVQSPTQSVRFEQPMPMPTPLPQKPSVQQSPASEATERTTRDRNTYRDSRQSPSSSSPAQARLEIEEEREDRRQVSKNGRLVFDDRLRERRFETQRSVSASPLSPISSSGFGRATNQQQQQLLKPISLSTATAHKRMAPQSGDLTRSPSPHSYVGRHAMAAAPASPPILFADQTSNLSSDPETMDSGFAQSGAGSGSALNQAHRLQQQQQHQGRFADRILSAPNSPGSRTIPMQHQSVQGRKSPAANNTTHRAPLNQHLRHLQHESVPSGAQLDESLTFVDDDAADELVEQLGGIRSSRLTTDRASSPRHQSNQQQQQQQQQQHRLQTTSKATTATKAGQQQQSTFSSQQRISVPPTGTEQLISPPPAFCAVAQANGPKGAQSITRQVDQSPGGDTELVTRLTRSRRLQPTTTSVNDQPHAKSTGPNATTTTKTKLEQSLQASAVGGNLGARRGSQADGCRFKAQVMFESDTDSMSTERHSAASSRSAKQNKELISETKFTRSQREPQIAQVGAESIAQANANAKARVSSGTCEHDDAARWDYSLRVNRMRGNKVDSRVNTHIEHSRGQPLINLEAS